MSEFSIITTTKSGGVVSVVAVARHNLLSVVAQAVAPDNTTKRITLWDNYNDVSLGDKVVIGKLDSAAIETTLRGNKIAELISEGRKVQAIKFLREQHWGLGLREAKELIESKMSR